jgi:hypothetical protein
MLFDDYLILKVLKSCYKAFFKAISQGLFSWNFKTQISQYYYLHLLHFNLSSKLINSYPQSGFEQNLFSGLFSF